MRTLTDFSLAFEDELASIVLYTGGARVARIVAAAAAQHLPPITLEVSAPIRSLERLRDHST